MREPIQPPNNAERTNRYYNALCRYIAGHGYTDGIALVRDFNRRRQWGRRYQEALADGLPQLVMKPPGLDMELGELIRRRDLA